VAVRLRALGAAILAALSGVLRRLMVVEKMTHSAETVFYSKKISFLSK
jgi:hypothetical protein